MSVVVIIKVPADVATARAFFDEHGQELKTLSENGKNEWQSREAFEKFFGDPEIANVMANASASGPPAIEFYEGLATADAF